MSVSACEYLHVRVCVHVCLVPVTHLLHKVSSAAGRQPRLHNQLEPTLGCHLVLRGWVLQCTRLVGQRRRE